MGDDSPDWQRPIDIVRQSLKELDIDISAQSVGDLDVNLNANSIGNLPIEIEAQNISGGVPIDLTTNSIGNLSVDLSANSIGDLPISVEANNITGGLPVDLETQSLGSLDVDINAQSVGDIGIDISAQSLGDVGIDISTQSLNLLDTQVQIEQSRSVGDRLESKSSTINDGDSEFVTFTPSSGFIWRVDYVGFRIFGPGGGGNHSISVDNQTTFSNNALDVQADAGDDIIIPHNSLDEPSTPTKNYPATDAAKELSVQSLVADSNNGIQFQYSNQTGGSVSNQRSYALGFERIEVA